MTSQKPQVKICGIKTPDALQSAIDADADFIGLVFFDRSPRAIAPEPAMILVNRIPSHIKAVGLFVDADNDYIETVLKKAKLDMIQLHGNEDPRRIAEIRTRFNLPVIKAVRIAAPEDVSALLPVQEVADWVLFDAKPSASSTLPGGNGEVFDWQILKNVKPARPWMLSGGLNASNVGAALGLLAPDAVDVSSGVEDAPGVKNPDKIRAFIQSVKSA